VDISSTAYWPKTSHDLNNPPASAGGILLAVIALPYRRLGLNHPPISIGGINDAENVLFTFSEAC
jgi:hypothetical protein